MQFGDPPSRRPVTRQKPHHPILLHSGRLARPGAIRQRSGWSATRSDQELASQLGERRLARRLESLDQAKADRREVVIEGEREIDALASHQNEARLVPLFGRDQSTWNRAGRGRSVHGATGRITLPAMHSLVFRLCISAVAGWINRVQQQVIE